jgi:hypothetical protein
LVLEDCLKCALADLRLIGSVGCVKLRTGNQGRNDRWDEVRISPSPKKTAKTWGLETLEVADEVRLRKRLREV